jgi:hypothetical protein
MSILDLFKRSYTVSYQKQEVNGKLQSRVTIYCQGHTSDNTILVHPISRQKLYKLIKGHPNQDNNLYPIQIDNTTCKIWIVRK